MDTSNNSNIRSLLDKPGRGKPSSPNGAAEEDSESDYSAYAHGRISRLPQLTLIFRLADGSAQAFAYAYFYAAEAVDPAHGFTLDFSQNKVKLQGRNLETLFRLICQHRASEVREADRSQSFEVAEDAPVVERIEFLAT